jgi:hypothetical protein
LKQLREEQSLNDEIKLTKEEYAIQESSSYWSKYKEMKKGTM